MPALARSRCPPPRGPGHKAINKYKYGIFGRSVAMNGKNRISYALPRDWATLPDWAGGRLGVGGQPHSRRSTRSTRRVYTGATNPNPLSPSQKAWRSERKPTPSKGSKGERGAEDPLPQWEKRGKQGHRTVRAQRPLNWLDWGSPNRAPSASTICPRSSPRPLSAQHCSVGCDLKSFHPLLQAARAVPSCCASSHPSRPAL